MVASGAARVHLDVVEAPARDLDEASVGQVAGLDRARDEESRDGARDKQQRKARERGIEQLHKDRGARRQMPRPSISGVSRSIMSRSFVMCG